MTVKKSTLSQNHRRHLFFIKILVPLIFHNKKITHFVSFLWEGGRRKGGEKYVKSYLTKKKFQLVVFFCLLVWFGLGFGLCVSVLCARRPGGRGGGRVMSKMTVYEAHKVYLGSSSNSQTPQSLRICLEPQRIKIKAAPPDSILKACGEHNLYSLSC